MFESSKKYTNGKELRFASGTLSLVELTNHTQTAKLIRRSVTRHTLFWPNVVIAIKKKTRWSCFGEEEEEEEEDEKKDNIGNIIILSRSLCNTTFI